jgi:hypothetical protein
MSPVWIVASTGAVIAAIVMIAVVRAVEREREALERQVRLLGVLAERSTEVRARAARTAAATDAVHDTLGSAPRR